MEKDEKTFEPLNIERKHLLVFKQPPDEVFSVLSPEGGNQFTPSTPTYLFGSNQDLPGAMYQVVDSRHDGKVKKAWIVVADYDPGARLMRNVVYIPGVELLAADFQCEPGTDGGTLAVVTWRASGITEEGNRAVQRFFDKTWDSYMKSTAETLEALMEKK